MSPQRKASKRITKDLRFFSLEGKNSHNTPLRRPRSTYQKGCSRKNAPIFNGAVCSNTLFSNTSAFTSSLLFRAKLYMQRFSNTSFGRTLLDSSVGGLLVQQTFCRHLRPSHPHLIGWAAFRLQDGKKQRERRNAKAEKKAKVRMKKKH